MHSLGISTRADIEPASSRKLTISSWLLCLGKSNTSSPPGRRYGPTTSFRITSGSARKNGQGDQAKVCGGQYVRVQVKVKDQSRHATRLEKSKLNKFQDIFVILSEFNRTAIPRLSISSLFFHFTSHPTFSRLCHSFPIPVVVIATRCQLIVFIEG